MGRYIYFHAGIMFYVICRMWFCPLRLLPTSGHTPDERHVGRYNLSGQLIIHVHITWKKYFRRVGYF